jgi:hypothetical protein
MPKGQDLSRHQRKIVDRYYDNRGTIALTNLSEIASDLYLADTEGKQKRLWDRAAKAIDNLVKEELVTRAAGDRALDARTPEALAELVKTASGPGKR